MESLYGIFALGAASLIYILVVFVSLAAGVFIGFSTIQCIFNKVTGKDCCFNNCD